ncbi:MAG TPA: nucleotide disphospho-sugar-binding domain-containing protein [Steroidobacteraceae bacterium]|jgi:UDP:flavonoid glycosyltransferase YjiC (YdhE family)|nr:nucleotide disphospho-sugar-binding domain-containing protein [Steroidobacteraceae bacterium]
MARVLLATFGSLGDLHPYLAVGRALRARGHQARIATSSDYRWNVEAAGLEFAPVAPSLAQLGTPLELARRVADPMRGTRTLVRDLIMPHLREAHQQLQVAARDADLLISHPLTFMVQVVAAQQDKPWLSTVLAPASFLARDDPPTLAPINSMQIAHRLGPWVYDALMRYIRGTVRRWEQPLHALRAELGMPASAKIMVFEGQFSPAGTLALFDAPLMQPQPDWPPHTRLCGTPLYDGTAAPPALLASLQEFLAAGAAPIVFALGSSAIWLGGDFWPCAIEAARRLGRRAILITGADSPPDLPASMRVFNYLPYSQVFPYACAVVHQAGIGTLSQALRAGRPQLITPVWFDQPDNAARACKLGVARQLPFRHATAARLAQQLRQLLGSSSYGAAAQDLAATLNATDGAANAAAHILAALGSVQSLA